MLSASFRLANSQTPDAAARCKVILRGRRVVVLVHPQIEVVEVGVKSDVYHSSSPTQVHQHYGLSFEAGT